MYSNLSGDLNLGTERSSPTTNSSSRKGKKSSTEKLKQPQRGLGVAQLEKIRLHSQMGSSTYTSNYHIPFPSNLSQEDIRRQTVCSSTPSFSYLYSSSSPSFGSPIQQQSFMMGLSEMGNISFPDSVHQSTPTSRWNHGNCITESQCLRQPSNTRHFLDQQEEDLIEKRRKKGKINSMGSSSEHPGSGGNQELDLELRLAL